MILPRWPRNLLLLAAVAACGEDSQRVPASAATAPAPDSAAAHSAVTQAEERLRAAMVGADTAVLAGLLAPEYLSTSAVGHTTDRQGTLMAYGGGLVKVDSAAVDDLEVRPYGGAVVSVGRMVWGGTAAGRAFGGTVRFQRVWAWRDGGWQLVANQLTGTP
jgi:hypothetical protein